MNKISISDINLLDVGTKYMCLGQLWIGTDDAFLAMLPETTEIPENLKMLVLSTEDWEKFIFQMDVIETEIFQKDPTGKLVKAIVRRSQRTIEAFVTWKVYKRDNYTCRYCGIDGVPLTVDHILLWESGGPSTEENLLTACKKCNKIRGNMSYEDWLKDSRYLAKAQKLTPEQRKLNEDILQVLPELEKRRYQNVRTR